MYADIYVCKIRLVLRTSLHVGRHPPEERLMGRLTKVIRLRVSEETWERLKKTADATGVSISDYIRQAIGEKRIGRPRPRREETEETRLKREWLYELNRIGVNLNQVARAVNKAMKEAPNEETFRDMVEALSRLKEIEEDLHALTEAVRDAHTHR